MGRTLLRIRSAALTKVTVGFDEDDKRFRISNHPRWPITKPKYFYSCRHRLRCLSELKTVVEASMETNSLNKIQLTRRMR